MRRFDVILAGAGLKQIALAAPKGVDNWELEARLDNRLRFSFFYGEVNAPYHVDVWPVTGSQDLDIEVSNGRYLPPGHPVLVDIIDNLEQEVGL